MKLRLPLCWAILMWRPVVRKTRAKNFPGASSRRKGWRLAPFDGDPASGESVAFEDAMKALAAIGYDAPEGDYAAALLAFQRRYCPQSLGQGPDSRTRAALMEIAAQF